MTRSVGWIMRPGSNEELRRRLEARAALAEECGRKGHVSSGDGPISRGSGGTYVFDTCKRCGMPYQRKPNSNEYDEFDRLMRTPLI